jgi:hypothetical protein
MASEEQELHSRVIHVGHRITVVVVTTALLAAVVALVARSGNLVHLSGLLVPAIVMLTAWFTVWRASRVFASELGLRIQAGSESRFVAWEGVKGVEVPFWVVNPQSWFDSRFITLRDGSRVLFFPAPGALTLLESRVRSRGRQQ